MQRLAIAFGYGIGVTQGLREIDQGSLYVRGKGIRRRPDDEHVRKLKPLSRVSGHQPNRVLFVRLQADRSPRLAEIPQVLQELSHSHPSSSAAFFPSPATNFRRARSGGEAAVEPEGANKDLERSQVFAPSTGDRFAHLTQRRQNRRPAFHLWSKTARWSARPAAARAESHAWPPRKSSGSISNWGKAATRRRLAASAVESDRPQAGQQIAHFGRIQHIHVLDRERNSLLDPVPWRSRRGENGSGTGRQSRFQRPRKCRRFS